MKRVPFLGHRVWHHGWFVSATFTLLALGLVLVANLPPYDGEDALTAVERLGITFVLPAAVWIAVLRPRIAILDNEIAVVQWRRTIRFPAALLIGADSGYYGTDLRLSDNRVVNTATLQRPNWAAWTGRMSRADRIVHELLCQAAATRGDPEPEPPGSKRSKGDLSGGLGAAIGAALRSLFN